MAQAAADLPDPLENRPEPAGDNDELLAQLAGAEIDRLLADKEDASPAPDHSMPPPPQVDSPDAPQWSVGDVLDHVDNPDDPPEDDPADFADDAQAERDALNVEPAPPVVNAGGPSQAVNNSIPLILRPLVWLSAPLDYLPEAARASVGKIGLVTLLNAIAIFLYILFFRGH